MYADIAGECGNGWSVGHGMLQIRVMLFQIGLKHALGCAGLHHGVAADGVDI